MEAMCAHADIHTCTHARIHTHTHTHTVSKHLPLRMLLVNWLDLVAIATAAGMTGMGVATGISAVLSVNTSGDGIASNEKEGSSSWAGLESWWAWLKCPESVHVSLCQVSGNCPISPSKRFFVT